MRGIEKTTEKILSSEKPTPTKEDAFRRLQELGVMDKDKSLIPPWDQILKHAEQNTSKTQNTEDKQNHMCIKIPYPDQNCEKKNEKTLSTDELVDALYEDAGWIGDNNYEVPICLYDHLLMSAEAIKRLSALVENGQSAIETNKQLSEAVNVLSMALTFAGVFADDIGGCPAEDGDEPCYRFDKDDEPETKCAKCLVEFFLKQGAIALKEEKMLRQIRSFIRSEIRNGDKECCE